MNRLSMLASILLSLALSQTVMSQMNEMPPQDRSCGTEMAMAKMPGELKTLTATAAVAAQAEELLLFINFNQNGSVVRQGFGNADTLTSSIVSGIRFCPAPVLDQTAADEIVRLVSDDFSPFNIKVTTDATEFAAHPRLTKQMCLITTAPSTIGQPSFVVGVSPFAGPGLRLPGDLAFVFSSPYGNDPRDVAAVISHESAHLLGLGHQHFFGAVCGFLNEYHPGIGLGTLSFNPLMGESTGPGVSNWFSQDCPSPIFGLRQDDYSLINSQVAARPDDFPDVPEGAVAEGVEIAGILEREGDVDHIKINFRKPGPVHVRSDNIDLKVEVLTPGGHVIEEFNDPDGTNVLIPSAAGVRYLRIQAETNANMQAKFMTGTYRISY